MAALVVSYGALSSLAGVLVLAALGAGVAVRARTSLPPPLWTTDDLPPRPPREDNGWRRLASVDDGTRSRSADAQTRASLRALLTEGPAFELDGHAKELTLWVERDAAALERTLAALSAAELVEDCDPREGFCSGSAQLRGLRRVMLAACERSLAGDHARAVALADTVLRASMRYADSASTVGGMAVSLQCLLEAMQLVELLLGRADRDRVELAQARAALLDALERLASRRIDLGRAIVGEYLVHRARLEAAAAHPLARLSLVDWEATADAIDAHYRAAHAYATTPSAARPPTREHRIASYAVDPTGTVLARRLQQALDLEHVELLHRHRAAVLERAATLRARLG
jgi:hypothetical protein